MRLSRLDLCLFIFFIIFLIADIIFAFCIGFLLRKSIRERNTFPADGTKVRFEKAVRMCPCLHGYYPNGAKGTLSYKVTEVTISKEKSKRSVDEFATSHMKKYPFLVALSLPAYKDDTGHKIFSCSGLILSTKWMLTSESCVQDDSEWFNLTVRSESPFWGHLGREHAVIKVVRSNYDGLVQLQISPKFSERIVPLPPIKYLFTNKWNYAVSLGWNDNMYRQKLAYRYKHKVFDVEKWKTGISKPKSTLTCLNCGKFSSKVLLTTCHQVVGMESVGQQTFSLSKNLASEMQNACSQCYPIHQDIADFHFEDGDICHNYN
ncbi:hypothetical protein Zmor_006801 [Zophobas morio]|uniref:Peptidase S1 domain-containing protein n=1 Tax=Zophobas morio TaxID=2755281 RepID=A0AA38MNW5_9CUCU|nr:hypothetical protein Zmor_006801 [Zophobas morio]